MKKITYLLSLVLLPFAAFSQPLDCANMCVTNVAMNAEGGMLDITIINGSSQINYPIVTVIVDGDTVGNIGQQFFIFAHISAQEFTHTIPTSLNTVPADFTCVVTIEDSTTGVSCTLNYPCVVDNVQTEEMSKILLYPNPAIDLLFFESANDIHHVQLFDLTGKMLRDGRLDHNRSMEVGHLSAGIYLVGLTLRNGEKQFVSFVKD